MSRRRELEQHRHRLNETREIINSMRALAFMETRKLASFLDAQRAVVAHIHTVAEDFFSFYPEALPQRTLPQQTSPQQILPQTEKTTQVYLLLGSERGFCGDFNESLLPAMAADQTRNHISQPWIIATGNKLSIRLEANLQRTILLQGTSMVEEIEKTLVQIVDTLSELQIQNGGISLTIVHHDPDQDGVLATQILPPFESLRDTTPQFTQLPLLNLTPGRFCAELIDRYLFSSLHEIMYLSLMAENQRRVTHLEHAVQQLDDKSAALLRRGNRLRQEEITEEIEVILLSAAGFQHPQY
ncbi:MAG: F0F1 ATP synthase subunit gamma [Gammaproteobacteria bacterium]|nr:MAG: F0F1 ATP synthase subunit gamma [Gammaproteobacteria bacterium]RLA47266.1 MAG: F0F1 ATP synthase subunit gamma [Gammaproteobacteria bacterium]